MRAKMKKQGGLFEGLVFGMLFLVALVILGGK